MFKKNVSSDNEEIAFESHEINDEEVGTMQDDLADLIVAKKQKPGSFLHRRQKSRDQIKRELADVYTNGDGEIPDMTKLEKAQRPLWKTILYSLIAVFSVLFALSVVGFLIFSNLNSDTFTNEKVLFKVEPPISIVSGQDGTYNIIITNNERVNLYDLHIQLFYPDSFAFVDANPKPNSDQKNIWDISILKVGETQKIEFKGQLTGALNSVSSIRGLVTFKPANLNADFKQETVIDLPITSSVISLDVSGPDKTLANDDIEYVIKYKNLGTTDLNNLEFVAEYPGGFVFSSSTPDPKDGVNNIWDIEKLASSTEGQITIRGNYSALNESGNQEIKFKVNLQSGGEAILQTEGGITTSVVKDQITMNLIINGSAEGQPIGFGDLMIYTLNYKNTGQEELKNVELKAVLDSKILDWDTLNDNNHGKHRDNYITWTGKEVPKLLKLAPGDEGSISWQIRVKDLSALGSGDISQFNVESHAEAIIKTSLFNQQVIQSKPIENTVNSDLNLTANARYYNDDNIPLGLGPIQPKVGETSVYNIALALNNNLHNISNIEVSGVLPKNVSWADKEAKSTGDLSYNSKTRVFSWKISQLLKTAKDTSAQINLSITPTNDDLGRVLILLPEISLTAKDVETGATISKKLKAITTSFNDPILGQLSGIVE